MVVSDSNTVSVNLLTFSENAEKTEVWLVWVVSEVVVAMLTV